MTAQELKNSILHLAVQGKLVLQCKDDEPASELLKQILAEKKKLGIKEKPLPEITEDEIPFDIPDSWEWVKLGKICKIATGKKDSNFGDENGKYYFFTCAKEPIRCKSFSFEGESILIAGNGDINNISYYDGQYEAYQRTYVIQPYIEHSYLYYLLFHLKSNWVKYNINKMFGSAIPYIRLNNVQNYMVALPPLAEQKRIVEKIEELMPLIEEYGKAEEQLSKLNAEFPDKLRKSILQQAVQGKLTERDPADEPASVLLKRIKAEKEALIKAGKIKKEKPLPAITDDEKPFDIPNTWEWVRLGAVIDIMSGFAFRSTYFKQIGKHRLLRGVNLSVGNTRWDDTVYIDEMPENLNVYQIHRGDVLIGLDRPWISDGIRVAIFDEDEDTYLVQRVLRVRETTAITKDYIALLLRSNLFRNSVERETTGISVPHISSGQVCAVAIPLPPLAEQKRIVKRVEELLALCDELK